MKTKTIDLSLNAKGVDTAAEAVESWLTDAGVKRSDLAPKLIPAFLVGLTTASSAATFSTAMETYEKRLGVDSAFARTAFSIGTLLCAMSASLYYICTGARAWEIQIEFTLQADRLDLLDREVLQRK